MTQGELNMSEINSELLSSEKPSELLEIEKAVMDLNAYHNAVRTGTFAGNQAQAVVGLLGFLKQTFQQLEEQYRNHPFIQNEMEKARKQSEADEAEMKEMGMVNE
jgi:hypothetical protein